jgi:tRNA (cmo5U34)-methyltransferase
MTNAPAIFDVHASEYEALRRRLVLPYEAFYNAEQVRGPSALFEDAYARWHERCAPELGTTAQDWAAARARMLLDQLATVDQQLGWLREAGFTDTDCVFEDHAFAVLVARRA